MITKIDNLRPYDSKIIPPTERLISFAKNKGYDLGMVFNMLSLDVDNNIIISELPDHYFIVTIKVYKEAAFFGAPKNEYHFECWFIDGYDGLEEFLNQRYLV